MNPAFTTVIITSQHTRDRQEDGRQSSPEAGAAITLIFLASLAALAFAAWRITRP